jgi:hypothetical protein
MYVVQIELQERPDGPDEDASTLQISTVSFEDERQAVSFYEALLLEAKWEATHTTTKQRDGGKL